jgi:hypothetical protein
MCMPESYGIIDHYETKGMSSGGLAPKLTGKTVLICFTHKSALFVLFVDGVSEFEGDK